MEHKDIIDISHEIVDELQREAAAKLQKAQSYHEGYIQACDDFGRRLRMRCYEEANKKD